MVWNDRMKQLRDGSGVSLKDMAELCGVSEATAQRYESGHIKQVPYEAIIAYAEKFRCSPAYLMGWEDDTPYVLHPDESLLLRNYHRLNRDGKGEALKRISELTELVQYTKKENLAGGMVG